MAKIKKTSTEKNALDKDKLIDLFMNQVLEHGETPKSIYKFCKENKIKEADFYNFYGSFDGLRKGIWVNFYEHSLEVIGKSEEYEDFNNREKLLTFYYTFFEILTANRSYVLFTLKQCNEPLKNLGQLKGLRKQVKSFASELVREENSAKSVKILKQSETIFAEGVWLQFLFLLKFWLDDDSPQFESTDVAIEKSVNTAFDVFDNTPLEKVVDLGKFLWKERMK